VYRKSVAGGAVFLLADVDARTKTVAFDHEKLAAALSAAGEKAAAQRLPFQEAALAEDGRSVSFELSRVRWRCALPDYSCRKVDMTRPAQEARTSPDGKWEALISNYNVLVREKGKTEAPLKSMDGSEGNYYTPRSLAWSPDSRNLVAYRVRSGYRREVHYIESSPADQLQPKHSTREYAKPGDAVDIARPVLFAVESRRQTEIDASLFANPYELSRPVWWKDSRGFTFEFNERGHQAYRVIEVEAASGRARALIEEKSETFVDYRPLIPNPRDTGKKVRYDLADGKEIVWGSERDGWEHLYLYDGATGRMKQQITRGEWVVRAVDRVDEARRQIWFQASGMKAGVDPYFTYACRINFDGSGLTVLSEGEGEHAVRYATDGTVFTDVWSRIDQAPVLEVRDEDGKKLWEVERGDAGPLKAAGWREPIVFHAPGRDGKAEIWGLIYPPAKIEPGRQYPVVESIYAGPQGSFVPKTFGAHVMPLTELGFAVAQIDGMGTNNRSKAFHAVAWRNLGDAGLADRVAWHRAAAAKYPWYDISRVGVYGTSAGGQSALGALLFQPDFYKAAVANSGCHDNRMDKIWWNEQWMGWPLGPHYAASSNVENAAKLRGKLLLVVPEMDTNVDPASSWQVANALIKANKKFELLFVPGGGHGAGGAYGQRVLQDFFVHHLLGQEPPEWDAGN
jgi:dipeptidyl aminopeptidase/acylaminoacyl peptidase